MSSRQRLLFLITKSELGGAQSHVGALIEGFSSRYEVHLATGAMGPLTQQAQAAGAQVHLLPRLVRSVSPLADFRSVRECAALVRRIEPHLIHAHSSKAGIVGRLAGRLTGVPVVFTAHGWGFSPGAPRARRIVAAKIEKLMAPLARHIICVSEFDRQLALRFRIGPENRLHTVRCGIETGNAAPNQVEIAAPATQPPRFIMVARFSEQKDQPTLLRALSQIEEECHLDLVGSGPLLSACQALAEKLGVASRVSFLGDRRDVAALLARSHCFVLSTHYEGLPISILEAMRAGLPVIATDVGGICEEIEPGTSGLLVAPQNAEELAQALRKLIRDPAARARLGQAGRKKCQREFSLERLISGVDAVYEKVWKN